MNDQISLTEFSTEAALYTKLKELYRYEFPVGYSLVINYDEDTFSNAAMPGNSLSLLIRILHELDIPNFFVTIKTSKSDILGDLAFLNSKNSYGIVNVELSDTLFQKTVYKSDTFCSLPWVHVYFNPQGDVLPCCVADNKYPLGNYTNQKIDFNSDNIVSLRKSLLSGERVPQCTFCYRLEDLGMNSHRQNANIIYKNKLPVLLEPIVEDFKLRHVDVRLSNVCNLKCRMCDGKFSSRIAEEDFKIWGITEYLNSNIIGAAEQQILNLVKEQINNIETVYFAGGEPLINDCHYDILDVLIENNKKDTHITYNTNFSKLKYKNKSIIDYWNKFNDITVGASIDLIGSASNYVRNGVDYQVLEKNYQIIQQECPTVKFKITSTLSVYNLFNLCDLQYRWINDIGLLPKDLYFSILTNPDSMQFSILPADIKIKASERIEQHCAWLTGLSDSNQLIIKWKDVLRILSSENNQHLISQFFKMGDIRDRHRNQKFENYFPEYASLRSYTNNY
jgi:MoaA/NifB/PqqE/SkfB family radical SAM enzyme